jgi:hypothetical protein
VKNKADQGNGERNLPSEQERANVSGSGANNGQPLAARPGGPRRLFIPRNNLIVTASKTLRERPRAILRVLSRVLG